MTEVKKRLVSLLLGLVLALGLVGCGNNAGTGQESNVGVEQEAGQESSTDQEADAGENTNKDIPGEDVYWGYIYDEPQKTDFEPNWEYYELYSDYVEIPMNKDTNFYDDNGNIIGYMYDRKDIDDTINVSAVAEDYVRTRITIKDNLTEVNIRHEDLDDSLQVKELFTTKKQETEENDVDGLYAREVFDRILMQGGMEVDGESLIQIGEDRTETGGYIVDIPRENTGEWAKEKRQAFLDKGLKYYYMQYRSSTQYTASVMLWLGTEDKQPISEDEIKAFFQSESDDDIQKMSNPYYDLFEKVGLDTNETYTIDEYMEFFTKIFEEMGKTSNSELAQMNPMNQYDGFHIERVLDVTDFSSENLEGIMNYIEYGRDGRGGITEFCVLKGKNSEGAENLNIILKVDHSQMSTD